MNSVSYRLLLIVWLLGIGLGLGNLNAGAYAKTQLIRTEAHQYMPLVPVLKTYPEKLKQRLQKFKKKFKRPTKKAFDVNELNWWILIGVLMLIFVPPAVFLLFGMIYGILWMLWLASIVAAIPALLFLVMLVLDYGQVFSDDIGVISYLFGTLFQGVGVPNGIAMGIAGLIMGWTWAWILGFGIVLFVLIFGLLSLLTI